MSNTSSLIKYKPLKWELISSLESDSNYEEIDGPSEEIQYMEDDPSLSSENEGWFTRSIAMENEDRKLVFYEFSNKNLIKDGEPCKMNYKILLINKKNFKIQSISIDPDSYDDLND